MWDRLTHSNHPTPSTLRYNNQTALVQPETDERRGLFLVVYDHLPQRSVVSAFSYGRHAMVGAVHASEGTESEY